MGKSTLELPGTWVATKGGFVSFVTGVQQYRSNPFVIFQEMFNYSRLKHRFRSRSGLAQAFASGFFYQACIRLLMRRDNKCRGHLQRLAWRTNSPLQPRKNRVRDKRHLPIPGTRYTMGKKKWKLEKERQRQSNHNIILITKQPQPLQGIRPMTHCVCRERNAIKCCTSSINL